MRNKPPCKIYHGERFPTQNPPLPPQPTAPCTAVNTPKWQKNGRPSARICRGYPTAHRSPRSFFPPFVVGCGCPDVAPGGPKGKPMSNPPAAPLVTPLSTSQHSESPVPLDYSGQEDTYLVISAQPQPETVPPLPLYLPFCPQWSGSLAYCSPPGGPCPQPHV